eukprot:CAMPEP_0171224328 /NCGR_PEP_ID=MMETSP0790-20130122/36232_1 /TAXON_ID=2925 /ORGANISM="Alexandrium catenella, Strain OF101" /LENGTH=156 /DNA_ID=CAMNT_0011690321 /DNA_START=1 /DNA_END=471 /DNA_ORIENTATION=+
MALSSAADFPAEAFMMKFEKQVSDSSTVVPTGDDFCRDTTAEQENLHAEADTYEARGGLAEQLAWQLPKPAGGESLAATPVFVGSKEVDLYEARGGMAERFGTAAAMDVDEYEARGGIAAQVQCLLPGFGAQAGLPRVLEGDEYEMRGGLAAWRGI